MSKKLSLLSFLSCSLSMASFQEPKLEVPSICKAYFLGLNFREYLHKIWPKIWHSTSILGSWNSHWYLPLLGIPSRAPAPHRTFPWALLMAKYTPVSPYFLGELNDGRSGYPMSDMSQTRVYHMFFHVNGKKYLKILTDIQRYPIFRQYHMSKNGSAWIYENEVCVCDKCHATNTISPHGIDNFPDILK